MISDSPSFLSKIYGRGTTRIRAQAIARVGWISGAGPFVTRFEEAFARGLVVFPSKANYILFDAGGTGKTGKEIISYAESKGYILRGESEKYGSDGWFRITIGTKDENRGVVEVIKELLAKK